MTQANLEPLRDDVTATILSGKKLVNWIASKQDGLEIKKEETLEYLQHFLT